MSGEMPYKIIDEHDYQLIIYQNTTVKLKNDNNVDVEVVFKNGKRYVATMFTLDNIHKLIDKYKESGECDYGRYFWAADMILLRELSISTIRATVKAMILCDELKMAFAECRD